MKDGFIFPKVEELTSISHNDIVCVLPLPQPVPTQLDCKELLNFYLKNF